MDFFSRLAQVSKYLVPPTFRPRLRTEYSMCVRKWQNHREKRRLARHLRSGGTYISWYGERLDTMLHTAHDLAKILDQYPSGFDDLNAAKALGLEPHHTLHEFGCGTFRAGHCFIEYLESGNYSANDASSERIADGIMCLEKYLGPSVFKAKAATFIVNPDNSFDWLKGRTFDYIWAGAVLGHMPESDITDLFQNIRKAMHEGSRFAFTYSHADINEFREFKTLPTEQQRIEAATAAAKRDGNLHVIRAILSNRGQDCIEVSVKDWFHSLAFFKRVAEPMGFTIEDVIYVEPLTACSSFPIWSGIALARLR